MGVDEYRGDVKDASWLPQDDTLPRAAGTSVIRVAVEYPRREVMKEKTRWPSSRPTKHVPC